MEDSNESYNTNHISTAPAGIDDRIHAWSDIQRECGTLLLGAVHRGCNDSRRHELHGWHCFYKDLALKEYRLMRME